MHDFCLKVLVKISQVNFTFMQLFFITLKLEDISLLFIEFILFQKFELYTGLNLF